MKKLLERLTLTTTQTLWTEINHMKIMMLFIHIIQFERNKLAKLKSFN